MIAILFWLGLGIGIALGIGIDRRLKKPGILSAIFFSTIMVTLSLTTLISAGFLTENLYAQIMHPKYTATVVGSQSHWDTDSDGNSQEMHTARLRFTQNNGKVITIPSTQSSGWKPVVGDTRTVRYQDGQLHEPSIWLYGMLLLMLAVSGFFTLVGAFFACGRSADKLVTIGVSALLFVIVPGGLLFMGGAMLWSVYEYIFGYNRAELSGGAAVLIGLFGALILFCGWGYVLMLRKNRQKRVDADIK